MDRQAGGHPDAALAEMAAQPCDVVVADCALPGANQGVELLDRIHTEYPKTIRILLAGERTRNAGWRTWKVPT